MAYAIDPRTGDWSYDKYVPLEEPFIYHDNMHERISGSILEKLMYSNREKTWLLFSSWDWV